MPQERRKPAESPRQRYRWRTCSQCGAERAAARVTCQSAACRRARKTHRQRERRAAVRHFAGAGGQNASVRIVSVGAEVTCAGNRHVWRVNEVGAVCQCGQSALGERVRYRGDARRGS